VLCGRPWGPRASVTLISPAFALFMAAAFLVYWTIGGGRPRRQVALLLVASWGFYAAVDVRFLLPLLWITAIAYAFGLAASRAREAGTNYPMGIGVVLILAPLVMYKYVGFLDAAVANVAQGLGLASDHATLHLIAPIGISFYSFKAAAYVWDAGRGKVSPTRDPALLAAYIAFFPQLLMGPVQRPADLLGQMSSSRSFSRSLAQEGLQRILWGLLLKLVVADRLAISVAEIFDHQGTTSSAVLAVGAVLFAVQLYADFCGYSLLAIGLGNLLGFRCPENFNYPYTASSPREFWRRWNISVTTWFRDYVYIAMGGNRRGPTRSFTNIFVTFGVSGLWHGADWTFLVWGLLHAALYEAGRLVTLLISQTDRAPSRAAGTGLRYAGVLATFVCVTLLWIVFRSPSLAAAYGYYRRLFSLDGGVAGVKPFIVPLLIALLILAIDALRRNRRYVLEIGSLRTPLRWVVYYLVAVIVLLGGIPGETTFYYFKF
jgi:alginate O-acetyltransferase complex protein AlgI